MLTSHDDLQNPLLFDDAGAADADEWEIVDEAKEHPEKILQIEYPSPPAEQKNNPAYQNYVVIDHDDAPVYFHPVQNSGKTLQRLQLENKLKQIKQPFLIMGSITAAAPLAMIALGSLTHIKPENLTLDNLKELPPFKLGCSITNGLCSLLINGYLGVGTIPRAFDMLSERTANFLSAPLANTGIIILASGAGLASAAMGYSAFIPLGSFAAGFNFLTSGFLFWVTRFYGLVNALRRFEKYSSHRFENHVWQGRTFEDLLTHLTDDTIRDLNQYLRENRLAVGEETVVLLLNRLDQILHEDRDPNLPKPLKPKTKTEKLADLVDVVLAVIAATSVSTIFAQKFIDGLTQLEHMFSPSTHAIAGLDPWVKVPVSMVLSSASSFLYFGQTLLIRQTLFDGIKAIYHRQFHDPTIELDDRVCTVLWKKFVTLANHIGLSRALYATGYPLLLIANGFAATGLYGLACGVQQNPTHFANPFLQSSVLFSEGQKLAAAIGAFCVNANITIGMAYPKAPGIKTIPDLVETRSSANLLKEDDRDTDAAAIGDYVPPELPDEKQSSTTADIVKQLRFSDAIDVCEIVEQATNDADLVVIDSSEIDAHYHPASVEALLHWLQTNKLSRESLHAVHFHHAQYGKPLFQRQATFPSAVGDGVYVELMPAAP